MASPGVNGMAVTAIVVGGVILYSGLKGYKVTDVVKSFVSGENPGSNVQSTPIESNVGAGNILGGGTGIGAGIPSDNSVGGGISQAANKQLGKGLAAPFGWATGDQWTALDNLFTRESGWSNTAENASSGAYGIAQALPPTKYPITGQKPISDPATQILWGLNYIRSRYGDPIGAWAHETSAGWY